MKIKKQKDTETEEQKNRRNRRTEEQKKEKRRKKNEEGNSVEAAWKQDDRSSEKGPEMAPHVFF